MMLSLFALMAFMASRETQTEVCTGKLLWKKCEMVDVPVNELTGWGIASVILVLIAIILLIFSALLYRNAARIKKYDTILIGAESMPILQLASITGNSPTKVREDLQMIISSGANSKIYIDYGNDRVVSKKYAPKKSRKTVVKCSECGGNNHLIIGMTIDCAYCGQPLLYRGQ